MGLECEDRPFHILLVLGRIGTGIPVGFEGCYGMGTARAEEKHWFPYREREASAELVQVDIREILGRKKSGKDGAYIPIGEQPAIALVVRWDDAKTVRH
jgi:hypothetical protein